MKQYVFIKKIQTGKRSYAVISAAQ